MTKIEQTEKARSSSRGQSGPVLHVANRVAPRSNVVSISSVSRRGPELVAPARPRRLVGRKGREAMAKRRALDGAFLTVAMGTVALLWWSAL